MATTTNYSWTTPDDTALVKDGAAAIRSLGSSIDTTTKALNPSTTLGDIEYRSATANTNTRLGIGTAGQVLSVNGGVPAWTTPVSGGMTLISTVTASGNTSVSFTSIPTTYKHLLLTYEQVYSSINDTAYWFVRFNNDSSTYYHYAGSSYSAAADGARETGGFGSGATNAPIPGGYNAYSNTGLNCFGRMWLFDYADASNGTAVEWKSYNGTNIGALRYSNFQGYYSGTSAVTQIDFLRNSTQTVTGTFRLYGVS